MLPSCTSGMQEPTARPLHDAQTRVPEMTASGGDAMSTGTAGLGPAEGLELASRGVLEQRGRGILT